MPREEQRHALGTDAYLEKLCDGFVFRVYHDGVLVDTITTRSRVWEALEEPRAGVRTVGEIRFTTIEKPIRATNDT